jgi:hypothetical protein
MVGARDVAPGLLARRREDDLVEKLVGEIEVSDAAAYPDNDRDQMP